MRAQLAAVFARDWSSVYTGPVTTGSGAGQLLYSQVKLVQVQFNTKK